MKVNIDLITREIGGILAGRSVKSSTDELRVSRVALFESLDRCEPDAIHVIDGTSNRIVFDGMRKDLCSTSRRHRSVYTTAFLCTGDAPEFSDELSCDILFCKPSITVAEAFNALDSMFLSLRRWESELNAVVLEKGTPQDLARESAGVVRNDIWVTDQDCRVLAYEVYRNLRLSQEQVDAIKVGEYMPKAMIDDGIQAAARGVNFDDETPSFTWMISHDCTTLSKGIRVARNYRVSLTIESNFRDVSSADLPYLEILGEHLRRLYVFGGYSFDDHLEARLSAILSDVVFGYSVPKPDLYRCLRILGWGKSDEYVCCCIDLSPKVELYSQLSKKPLDSVSSRLVFLADLQSFWAGDCLVCVVNLTRSGMDYEEFEAQIAEFADENGLVASLGNVVSDVFDTRGSFIQALASLLRARRLDNDGPVARFDDCRFDYLFGRISDEMSVESFCPMGLMRLFKYDSEHGSELALTLRTYLESRCNATTTSSRLFLQRNSVVYRIGKIRDISGIDFDDPEDRLSYALAFKILEASGNHA